MTTLSDVAGAVPESGIPIEESPGEAERMQSILAEVERLGREMKRQQAEKVTADLVREFLELAAKRDEVFERVRKSL